jgi:hypothetical protein
MNDNLDLENRLRGVMVAEPPLGFDPDDVASTAARRVRNRRATLGAGTATLAAIVAAVVLLAPGAGPTLVSPAAGPRPPVHVDMRSQNAINLDHLRSVLPAVVPEAARTAVSGFVQLKDGTSDWDAATASVGFLTGKNEPGAFTVTVLGPEFLKRDDVTVGQACAKTDRPAARCDKQELKDGSTLVLSDVPNLPGTPAPPGGVVTGTANPGLSAVHWRVDGTVVAVTASALDSEVAIQLGLPPESPAGLRSLGETQLVALATDPAFRV